MANEDADPDRVNAPWRMRLRLFDPTITQIHANFLIADTATTESASDAPGLGLNATTPFSPSNGELWTARLSGIYFMVASGRTDNAPPSGTGSTQGDYLAQVSLDCA